MKKFDLEEQFRFYLNKMQLDPGAMSEKEFAERRRSFMCGVSQLFAFLINDIEEMPDEDGYKALDALENDLTEYWTVQGIVP